MYPGSRGAQHPVEVVGIHVRDVLAQGVVGDKFHRSGFRFISLNNGLGNSGELQEDGFYFAQLDAVAAYFDLGIDPAEVFELPVVVYPSQVPGAINPAGGVVLDSQEIRNKGPLRQVLAVNVSPRARPTPARPISPISPRGRARSPAGSTITAV